MFTVIADPQTKNLVIPAVLVTGAARRIGKAISEDLAAHGYPVVIHCNQSVDDGEQLAQQIRDNGGQAAVVQADLSDASALQGLMDAASKPFGPIRLLINNASAFDDDRIGSLDPVLWDQHFALHLKAPVFLTEAMAKRLGPDESGLVVNIIDQRVWKLNPHFFSYTLSKTALWTATQTLAQALAPQIRVNAIGPGPTLPSSRQARADFDLQVSHLPLQTSPTLEEFGATIRYLWEMKSVTGQMIALDGGQHLAWETPDIAGIKE